MPRAPYNTGDIDPTIMLAETMSYGSVGAAIAAQEADGQKSLVHSDTLPARFNTPGGREALEAAGVVFGDTVPGDRLFVYATLPEGWSKSGTDHPMWNNLLDDKGRVRATMFYKAAFYDRDAFIDVIAGCRINVHRSNKTGKITAIVMCGQNKVFITEYTLPAECGIYSLEAGELEDEATKEAESWLDEHYPKWRDPSAYWD